MANPPEATSTMFLGFSATSAKPRSAARQAWIVSMLFIQPGILRVARRGTALPFAPGQNQQCQPQKDAQPFDPAGRTCVIGCCKVGKADHHASRDKEPASIARSLTHALR